MDLLTHSASGTLHAESMGGSSLRRRRRRVTSRWVGRWVGAWLALWLGLAVWPLTPELQAQSLGYQVKAAFLLNFTKFVDWPAAAFAAPDAPITICVIGDDPFGAILDRTVQGESVNGRAVRARRLVPEANPRSCHVLFISRSEQGSLDLIFAALRGSSTLTVSELPGFTRVGGMIEFLIEDGKVRFYISAAAADAAGVKLSSRLLRVAKEVRGAR